MLQLTNKFKKLKSIGQNYSRINAKEKLGKNKIVVLGSGWAGFRFLKGIDQTFWDVKVISPRNHFIFTPLLASTTVGTLEFRSIIEPTRSVCWNYIQAECQKINSDENKLICYDNFEKGTFEVNYDYLVIAVGTTPNTFNTPGVKEYSHFLRQIKDAREIRTRLITCLEEASSPMTTPEESKRLMTFVIVGGGPTSCEFSAELHDFLETDFKKWFPQLSINSVKIILIESTDHILGTFDKTLSDYAEKLFKRQNVKILTNTKVKEVKKREVILNDGTIIPFGLCVWSTGNAPTDFVNSLNLEKDKGRILVDNHLRVKNTKNIFAIGDCATLENTNLPQTAQCAQQEGLYLSKIFNDEKKGIQIDDSKPFNFANRGMMSYVGRYNAIIDFSRGKMKGHTAWFFWRSAYLTKLVSVKNKFLVPMYWFKTFVFGRDISTV